MKRIILFVLFMISLFSNSIAEEEILIDVSKFKIRSSYSECLSTVKMYGIECDVREDGTAILNIPSKVFGKDLLLGVDLYFDENKKLQEIDCGLLPFDFTHEAYATISKVLGNADIIYIADYLDQDYGETYVDCSFPSYIVWKDISAVYELEIYSSFSAEFHHNIFSGTEIEADSTMSQLFSFRIYASKLFDEYSRMYK